MSLYKFSYRQNSIREPKIISLKKVTEINNESSNVVESNTEEQYSVLQLKVEKAEQQLASLKQQKEKMLNDLKHAIDTEKETWLKQKEKEKQQAKDTGYKIGYDEGKEAALKEYVGLINQANDIVSSATEDYHHTVAKHEEAIIQLAITVAEKIINDKISEDDRHFTSIIKQAIEELKDRSHVTIYVHPKEYRFVVKQKEELEQLLEDGEIISIYTDQQLEPGDCIIKHPFGQLDVSIDVQLQQIKNALSEKIMENADGY